MEPEAAAEPRPRPDPGKRFGRRLAALLLLAAVLLAAAWPKLELGARSGPDAGRAVAGRAAPAARLPDSGAERPVRVTVEAALPVTFAETVSSSGSLRADESVDLQAETAGRVTAILFAEGERVARGALLVKLNDADLKARRVGALHELELARRRQSRAAELLDQGFVRRDEHDVAVNNVRVREAEVELIDAQISKTEIRAPFDGVAGLRHVSEGALVGAATRIATLQRTDTVKIDFSVAERYAHRVRVGNRVTCTVAGGGEFDGQVYAYEPSIDPETRTLRIRASAPNPGGVLPGSFASVRLTLDEVEDVLFVPAESVVPDFDAAYVFVATDGRAERRRVATGVRTASRVQLLSGVAAGELVITSGVQQLHAGAAVEFAAAGAGAILGHGNEHASAPAAVVAAP